MRNYEIMSIVKVFLKCKNKNIFVIKVILIIIILIFIDFDDIVVVDILLFLSYRVDIL